MESRDHAEVRLAVDLVVLTVREDRLQLLVIVRGNQPYRGRPALPGGFLRENEDLRAAAVRELAEETGLAGRSLVLEQIGAYDAPERDPRGRIVSVGYLAVAPDLPVPTAGSDATGATWARLDTVRGALAFDHDEIVSDALERARTRLEYTTSATDFCAEVFTMGELRQIYEIVWGITLDPRNFSRRILATEGFIEPTGDRRAQVTGRPAALYRRGPASRLNPPMLRPQQGEQ
ncbi:NUDIX domain-containing protein [Longispora sp. NPDC051575]|uniref:NUDIX hydrolase n=1 Tax=Longispora sp. NPDC051575 TaxID=3154943 RepID=UPI0034499FEE